MPQLRRAGCTVALALVATLVSGRVSGGQNDASSQQDGRDESGKKPSLSLKATPPIGFSPLRVHLVAELKGGANDYQDLYCASVEWDWGDGTVSESAEDCNPYESGKSQIRRRFSADHTYRYADAFRIIIRLKQKTRVIATSMANIQVRPGAREGF